MTTKHAAPAKTISRLTSPGLYRSRRQPVHNPTALHKPRKAKTKKMA